jgi:hypothetical protein
VRSRLLHRLLHRLHRLGHGCERRVVLRRWEGLNAAFEQSATSGRPAVLYPRALLWRSCCSFDMGAPMHYISESSEAAPRKHSISSSGQHRCIMQSCLY